MSLLAILFLCGAAVASTVYPTPVRVTYQDGATSVHHRHVAGMEIPESGPGILPLNDAEGGYRDPPTFTYPIPFGSRKFVWIYHPGGDGDLFESEWNGSEWVPLSTAPFSWVSP